MAKATPPDPETTIEGLLQQRSQYEQWLARLDSAGDKAPAAVRERVRGDYEARLKGVIEQLRGHASTISDELERHRKTQSGLDREKRTVEEELSEAEVRHAVGEYSAEEWSRVSQESNDRLGRLRGELSGVGHEIARLAEVQGLISGTPKRAEPPSPPPVAVAPEPEPEPPPPEPSRQRQRPRGRAPRRRRASPRSPTVRPRRMTRWRSSSRLHPRGKRRRPPAPAPAASGRRSNPGSGSGGRSGEAAVAQAGSGKAGAAGVAKTLKCGECGTLNRPTEWYCERCGAELAGI